MSEPLVKIRIYERAPGTYLAVVQMAGPYGYVPVTGCAATEDLAVSGEEADDQETEETDETPIVEDEPERSLLSAPSAAPRSIVKVVRPRDIRQARRAKKRAAKRALRRALETSGLGIGSVIDVLPMVGPALYAMKAAQKLLAKAEEGDQASDEKLKKMAKSPNPVIRRAVAAARKLFGDGQ